MATYQLGDIIKASVHLGEGFMGSGRLPFFQTGHTVPLMLV